MTSPKLDEAGSQASTGKYSFSLEDSLAIVRVTAYDRHDFRRAVISFPSNDLARFRNSLTSRNKDAPSSSMGTIENLPREIVLEVLRHLDMSSLFAFRRVNRLACHVVAAIQGYESVVEHASGALLAILRTELSKWYTIDTLFALMRMRDCELCMSESKRSFAGFLSLPTITRCCFRCMHSNQGLSLISLADATHRAADMTCEKLYHAVPVLKTLPGKYCMDQTSSKQEDRLVPLGAVEKYFMRSFDGWSPHFFPFAATTALPFVDVRSNVVDHGVSCKGCKVAFERQSAILRADYYTLHLRRNAQYSERGFLEHFRYCEEAQALWELSERGMFLIEDS